MTAIATEEPFEDEFLADLFPLPRHGSAIGLWLLAVAATSSTPAAFGTADTRSTAGAAGTRSTAGAAGTGRSHRHRDGGGRCRGFPAQPPAGR